MRDRVGVVGLGGLGHLAVMYARAMGCDVTVFSRREEKRADALALGATDFRLLGSQDESNSATAANVDVMLLCGGRVTDLELYVRFIPGALHLLTIV